MIWKGIMTNKAQININKSDIVWSFLNYGANVLSNMLVLLFAVAILPDAEMGMWYTFLSLGAIAQLVDFGFLPCITRNVSFAWAGANKLVAEGIPQSGEQKTANYDLLRTIICSSRYLYSLLSLLVLALSCSVGSIYIYWVSRGTDTGQHVTAWIIYALSLVLNIFFGYWTGCLQGIGAIRENNKAKVVSYVVLIGTTIVCLMFSFGLLAMAIGNLVSGLAYRILAKKFFLREKGIRDNRILDNKSICKQDVLDILKVIWPNSWKLGVNSLGTYFITQGNTLLCSAFLGLNATATYGLSLQICTALITVAKILMTTYQPRLVELNLDGDERKIIDLLGLIMFVFWLIVICGSIGLLTVGIPLIRLIKSTTALPYGVVLFMLLYLALEGNHSCFAVYLTTQNKIPFFKAGIISAICVFLVSLLLVRLTDWGIWALMLGQSLTQLAYNNWKWPHMVLTELSINYGKLMVRGAGEFYHRVQKEFLRLKTKSRKGSRV